jgi:hypothetical protein
MVQVRESFKCTVESKTDLGEIVFMRIFAVAVAVLRQGQG